MRVPARTIDGPRGAALAPLPDVLKVQNDVVDERAYWRARRNGQMACLVVPAGILFTIIWVFQYQGYLPGDWRGDLAMRALFGIAAIVFIAALGFFAIRGWRRAERQRRGEQS